MVEVVVEKKQEEKLSTKMNTNKVGDASSADVDNGKEEKLTVVVIGAAAAAGDHPTVLVDGKKLKAWVTQLIMWSCVYYLMYWIRMVTIKMDYYYGVATFLLGIFPFSFAYFGFLVTGGIDTVNKINSLVLFVNNNIIPSLRTFTRSSTTSIDEMKKEITECSECLLFISLLFNFMHMITMEVSRLILELFIGTKKVDDWNSQVRFGSSIFFVTILHMLFFIKCPK